MVTGSQLGTTAGSTIAITADEIIDLIQDKIFVVICKLKGSQNRHLFKEGQDGAPDKITGVRYVINRNMDGAMASGKKTMLAGAFKKFKTRDADVLRVKKLEERYAELDQFGFIAFLRSVSKVLDAGAGPIRHDAWRSFVTTLLARVFSPTNPTPPHFATPPHIDQLTAPRDGPRQIRANEAKAASLVLAACCAKFAK